MWALTNQTPFAAERAGARSRIGEEIWIVVIKATFQILPDGTFERADQQEPVRLAPLYTGEPGKSSLLYDTDLVRTKPTTDVLLHGHAYAPGAEPTPEVEVILRVGPINKTLRVLGDRTWKSSFLGPKLSAAEPFTQCPLVYERTYGGTHDEPVGSDPRNPVGTGFVANEKDLIGRRAPNIEYPNDPNRPAGFGPIAPSWSPRLGLAGTYDDVWQRTRKPLVPEDFDDRFFQSAPEDQQAPSHLRGGEEVELINLIPGGRLCFALPRISLGCTTRFGRKREHHRTNLHTVILEPDRMRVQMVWHSALPCHFTLYRLQDTTVYEKQRRPSKVRLLPSLARSGA